MENGPLIVLEQRIKSTPTLLYFRYPMPFYQVYALSVCLNIMPSLKFPDWLFGSTNHNQTDFQLWIKAWSWDHHQNGQRVVSTNKATSFWFIDIFQCTNRLFIVKIWYSNHLRTRYSIDIFVTTTLENSRIKKYASRKTLFNFQAGSDNLHRWIYPVHLYIRQELKWWPTDDWNEF